MRHDPELASSPPVRYILGSGKEITLYFPLIVRCARTISSRSSRGVRSFLPSSEGRENPLRIVALVYPENVPGNEDQEERVDVRIEAAEGQQVKNLRYEATLVAEAYLAACLLSL